MSDGTKIEWSNATWNPTRGCTKVSAGCKHCYAETFAERFRGVKGHPYEQGFDVRLVPEALDLPLGWKKPRLVFVNSMSDLFHESVPDDFITRIWSVMVVAERHTFQVLTKRPARMAAFVSDWIGHMRAGSRRPVENIWLGTSVEDQATADERIPHLLATPAAVRFVSAEPLLSELYLEPYLSGQVEGYDPIHGEKLGPGLDWLIVGGESGPRARLCDLAWIRSLVEQCRAADVPCFVKQLGARPRSADGRWEQSRRDRKGGDPAEWPADLRVREMPARSTNVAQDRRRNRR
jgi:protein gp37